MLSAEILQLVVMKEVGWWKEVPLGEGTWRNRITVLAEVH